MIYGIEDQGRIARRQSIPVSAIASPQAVTVRTAHGFLRTIATPQTVSLTTQHFLAGTKTITQTSPSSLTLKKTLSKRIQISQAETFSFAAIIPFVPSSLGSLVGWWDANDAATLTDAGSGHCSQWNDKSSNANNVTQSTDAQRPIITASSIGGKTALVFTKASNMVLQKLTTSGLPSVTTGISFAMLGSVNVDGTDAFFDISSSTLTNTHSQLLHDNTNDILIRNSGNPCAYEQTYTSGTPDVFTGTMSATTNNTFLWINGTAANQQDQTNPANFAANNIRFGMLFQDVFPLGGKIAEIVFCSGELSTGDRQKLEGYLAWKWGTVADLPGGHPYKTTPPGA